MFLKKNIAFLFLLLCFSLCLCQNRKLPDFIDFPPFLVSTWFALDTAGELETVISKTEFRNERTSTSKCLTIQPDNSTIDKLGHYSGNMVIYNIDGNCFQCYAFLFRTVNIIQYKRTNCIDLEKGQAYDPNLICKNIVPKGDYTTWFREEIQVLNCKTTWEGTFSFTYEVDKGGGSICNSTQSSIVACQEPGSPYKDNQVFRMNFGRCYGITEFMNQKIIFQCMGMWQDGKGNLFYAMANTNEVKNRVKFRCMMTRTDQQYADNTRYYALSRFAECNVLHSPYEGPIRLKMWPAYIGNLGTEVYGTRLVVPSCNFPRNFTGTWFTTAEFDSDVRINATHIYFKTKLDQFMYRESVFACQQNRDSRYLVTAVTIGRCEVDYVCFAFMPRHHNIIRWRMSKPYRLQVGEEDNPDSLDQIFRKACTWSAFTLNRDDTSWRYYTFILNPPAPIPCPIGGRYNFTQIGATEEKYVTRIRGITERPRHMIDCMQYVSELKSCDMFPKWIYVDAEYCATLDHTAKPISEYDQPDRQLFCVGYWLEDMKSYMITYDMEDAVSNFRCWVYERRDWRDLYASRAIRAACSPKQTAYSAYSKEGASLALILKESERLWDSCPQRYTTGADPYSSDLEIFVVDDKNSGPTSNKLSISLICCIYIIYLTNSLLTFY